MLSFLKNKVILFVISRYLSYFLQFLNALIVAYVLGPYYLGIWGFVTLVLQYLNFGNFGIDLALNVMLSTGNLQDSKTQSRIASNALLATVFTSVIFLVLALIVHLSGVSLFGKYDFPRYLTITVVISCLNYFNILFLNICRTYSIFGPISVFQTLLQLLQLPMYFFFRESALIWALLAMLILAHVISLVYYLRRLPFRLTFSADAAIIGQLYRRGISLLAYALTFYILLLSTRSIVGYFYPVETMGLFTFAGNLAAALIVGLGSLEFVLFPKMINRLSVEEMNDSSRTMFTDVRYIYMTTAFLVILAGLLCYPVLIRYFSEYSGTVPVFTFLVICQVIISSGFGYATLIISRRKEAFLILHGIIALLINLALSVSACVFFEVDFSLTALFLVFAFAYYDIQVIRKGRELLGMPRGLATVLKDLVPLRSLPSLALVFCSIIFRQNLLFNALALVVFIALNINGYQLTKKYILTLFRRPTVVNIQE